ncbi:hypothetical protein [Staphylococcus aureus]|uniref:hypothetical protein n=1 Tax=Staphylococcus aureus TaxID=1280 RepID=UPI0004F39CE0|nr:hypothetical protein [Staphylococcus aureus]APZ40777.1 hypothetical protein BSG37_10565 [Staphylococcus aureus]OLN40474.1 hypothetical protein APW45_08770 [Staphylococcus aureus]OLN49140.1 hypothetical protein APW57_09860 [Staphylococcus aureus]OLN60594.1 hypothetical protein APW81_07740 [Staphylococcus aureus]OLN75596.1 hypothetical protein APX00_01700 [Staphylococcus aureus]
MKFKTTKECKSNNIFKRSQEINNRESEKGCLWGISMLILLTIFILNLLFSILYCLPILFYL